MSGRTESENQLSDERTKERRAKDSMTKRGERDRDVRRFACSLDLGESPSQSRLLFNDFSENVHGIIQSA